MLTDQNKEKPGVVQRVKSPVLTSQNKDSVVVNQSEPVGASDSKRAVPAIGEI